MKKLPPKKSPKRKPRKPSSIRKRAKAPPRKKTATSRPKAGTNTPASLRREAEKRLSLDTKRLEDLSAAGLKTLVHELGTHQIELEMQNEELRRAQEELVVSRQRYADLYESAPVGYVTLDEQGLIREANVIAGQMLGRSKRSLLNMAFKDFVKADDWKAFHEHRAATIESGRLQTREIALWRANESVFSVQLQSIAVEDADGSTVIRTSFSDITERKMAEQALRESEHAHRTLAENIPDIVYRVDMQQCAMKFFNNRIVEVTGYAPEELGTGVICSLEPHIFEDDRQRVINTVKQAIRDRSSFEVEYRFRHKNGGIVTLMERGAVISDRSGVPLFIDGVIRDITERKRAEESLRESEAKYRSLFDNMINGFAIHDIVLDDSGRPVDYIFREVNGAFERLTGLKAADIVGKRVTGVLPGIENDPADWIGTYGRIALAGGEAKFERRAAPLDKWYAVTAYSPRRGTFATIFEDITERKRAEEALRLSEEQFRRAIEEAPIPVIMHAEDGEVLQISRTWTQLTGYSIEDIRTFDEWTTHAVYGEGANLVRDHLRSLFSSSSGKSRVEFAIRTKSGDVRYWSFSASVPGQLADGRRYVVGMALDITDRKRSENALSESEHKFFLLFQKAGFGVVLATSPEGVFVDVNEAAERMFGYSREEIVGKTSLDLGLHPEPEARSRFLAAADKQGGLNNVEVKMLTRSGEEHCFLSNIILMDFGGRKYLIVTLVDITERKRAEEDVLRLSADIIARNVELEALNSELEAFNQSISHDLRAPLRSMAGFSTALTEEYADRLDEKGKDYLARIRTGSEKMTRLIGALLNLSRISRQEIDRADVDLSTLAASVVHNLQEASRERDVTVVIQEDIRAVVDADLFRIVLTNLLDNAWKFTSGAEHAKIEFGVREQKTRDGKSETVYYVKDNGAGFDQQYAYKMFWPFHRLHSEREFPGIGIGLATVDRIIRRHGGRVWAEGEVGKGATVYFTIG